MPSVNYADNINKVQVLFLLRKGKKSAFQGFYSGQHFYPLNMAQRKGFEPLYTFLHNTISNRARSTAPPSLHR